MKESLENKFNVLFDELTRIILLADDLEYLFKYSKDASHPSVSKFFLRVKYAMQMHFALDYCVFLSDKENFSLVRFVKSLEDFSIVNKQQLEYWKLRLEEIKNSNPHKTLRIMRDKVYAHRDNITSLHESFSTDLREAKEDLKKLNELFKEIGNQLFETSYDFGWSSTDKAHWFFEDLLKVYDGRKKYQELVLKGQKTITLDELKDFLFNTPI